MVTSVVVREPEGGAVQEGQSDWTLPSWDEIVRTHSVRVYRLAYRLTGNPHDAEDLTQEVFVRVFRSLSSYTPGTFEGWLHRITTNLFLDGARRKQRIRFEGLAAEVAQRMPGNEPSPAEAFDDTHLDEDIHAALKALPPIRDSVSSARPSNLMRCRRLAMSRNRFVVIRCSQPSKVPGV